MNTPDSVQAANMCGASIGPDRNAAPAIQWPATRPAPDVSGHSGAAPYIPPVEGMRTDSTSGALPRSYADAPAVTFRMKP